MPQNYLADLRSQYPDLADYSDHEVAAAVHQTDPEFKDFTQDEFFAALGLESPHTSDYVEQQGVIENMVDSVQHGVYSGIAGIGETAEQLFGVGEDLRDWASKGAKAQEETMSPDWQASRRKEIFIEDEHGITRFGEGATDWQTWVAQFGELAGQQADMLIPGGIIGKGIKYGAKGVAVERAATKATEIAKAAKAGDKEAAKMVAAAKAKAAESVESSILANTTGYGLMEGSIAGGNAGMQARDEVNNMPIETLRQSETFKKLAKELGSEEEARAQLAEFTATAVQSNPAMVVSNVFLGALGGATLERMLKGTLAKSRKGAIAKGVSIEGATEGGQGYIEHIAIGKAIQENADPSRDPYAGALAAGMSQAVIAGPMGLLGGIRTPQSDELKAVRDKVVEDIGDLHEEIKTQAEDEGLLTPVTARQPWEDLPNGPISTNIPGVDYADVGPQKPFVGPARDIVGPKIPLSPVEQEIKDLLQEEATTEITPPTETKDDSEAGGQGEQAAADEEGTAKADKVSPPVPEHAAAFGYVHEDSNQHKTAPTWKLEEKERIAVTTNRHGVVQEEIKLGQGKNGKWGFAYDYSDATGGGEGFGLITKFAQAYDSREEAIEGALQTIKTKHGDKAYKRFAKAVGTTPTDSTTADLDAAAHEAATSPENDLTEPTDAQKEAGNYQKGHVEINGHNISIENPAGSKRRPNWPALKHHYGYIKGTIGKDKDHLDVFLTNNASDESLPVFVIDQINPENKAFDEHKIIMGAKNGLAARRVYQANYEKGWKGLGAIKEFTQDEFRAWLAKGDTTKPVKLAVKKESPFKKKGKESAAEWDGTIPSIEEIKQTLSRGTGQLGPFKLERVESSGIGGRYQAFLTGPFTTMVETPNTVDTEGLITFYERAANEIRSKIHDYSERQKTDKKKTTPEATEQADSAKSNVQDVVEKKTDEAPTKKEEETKETKEKDEIKDETVKEEPKAEPKAEAKADANPYQAMEGKDISYEIEVEETGETYTVTIDAATAMRDVDTRLSSLQKLRECI